MEYSFWKRCFFPYIGIVMGPKFPKKGNVIHLDIRSFNSPQSQVYFLSSSSQSKASNFYCESVCKWKVFHCVCCIRILTVQTFETIFIMIKIFFLHNHRLDFSHLGLYRKQWSLGELFFWRIIGFVPYIGIVQKFQNMLIILIRLDFPISFSP